MKSPIALLLASSLLLGAHAGFAQKPAAKAKPRTAVASVQIDGVTHSAEVKLDAKGRILPNGVKWASITPGKGKSIFYWLGEHRQNSGIEFEKTAIAKNGYSLVTVGTTADAVTMGISLKDGKGFFKYQDLGSGNGNSQHVLTVKEK